MDSAKYIGLDVHKESISIAVLNAAGKIVMECVIETNATTDSAVFPRAARRVARHLRGRNLGRLAVRPDPAARHGSRGVQSSPECPAETRQQE